MNLYRELLGGLLLVAAALPWLNIWGVEFTYWHWIVVLAGGAS